MKIQLKTIDDSWFRFEDLQEYNLHVSQVIEKRSRKICTEFKIFYKKIHVSPSRQIDDK